jgi:lipoprotein-anchoring transpeptidase ErfK/SrfK
MPADYHDVLRRHVTGPSMPLDQRFAAYERARDAITARLRAANPPIPDAVVDLELERLEQAIRRLESEIAQASNESGADQAANPGLHASALSHPRALRLLIGVGGSCVVAALAAMAYTYFGMRDSPPERQLRAASIPSDRFERGATSRQPATAPYIFMRQLVYYRTTHPAGTVIVDKAQRHLYLVRPNVAAIRFGIALGEPCVALNGLLRVSRKEEAWDEKRQARAAAGNDTAGVGFRAVFLESDLRSIHGDRVAASLGRAVATGCFGLVDSDMTEIYDRLSIGNRVVVTN